MEKIRLVAPPMRIRYQGWLTSYDLTKAEAEKYHRKEAERLIGTSEAEYHFREAEANRIWINYNNRKLL
jgi:hypothetical protein